MNTTESALTPTALTPTTTTAAAEVLGWIEGQCHRMAAIVDGLDEQQLRATPLPSGWSMLGLLGHVRDSTTFWLHHVVLGQPVDFTEADDAWDNDPIATASALIPSFSEACADACAAVRDVPADAAPGWWPEGAFGGYRQDTVLGVLLHLLADNAAHAGQLDIARELTDGGVWDFSIHGIRRPAAQA